MLLTDYTGERQMTEKQEGIIAAIEFVAGLEAQRIALGAINAAVQGNLLPHRQYHANIEVKLRAASVLAPAGAIDAVKPS